MVFVDMMLWAFWLVSFSLGLSYLNDVFVSFVLFRFHSFRKFLRYFHLGKIFVQKVKQTYNFSPCAYLKSKICIVFHIEMRWKFQWECRFLCAPKRFCTIFTNCEHLNSFANIKKKSTWLLAVRYRENNKQMERKTRHTDQENGTMIAIINSKSTHTKWKMCSSIWLA